MFIYDKALQYPVRIQNTNPRLASIIISQYGGPDGELGASLRYLSQRYSMPTPELKGLLTDIGMEASEMLLSALAFLIHTFISIVRHGNFSLLMFWDHRHCTLTLSKSRRYGDWQKHTESTRP